MRLVSLVSLLILGLCLAYARHVQLPTLAPVSYDGPATFISLGPDDASDPAARWLLVCRVQGVRIAFSANDARVRRAIRSFRPGQAVRLRYELPATRNAYGYARLGPPIFRTIAPACGKSGNDALAFDTSGGG